MGFLGALPAKMVTWPTRVHFLYYNNFFFLIDISLVKSETANKYVKLYRLELHCVVSKLLGLGPGDLISTLT